MIMMWWAQAATFPINPRIYSWATRVRRYVPDRGIGLTKRHISVARYTANAERPIGDLLDALVQIGVQVEYTGNAGYPPFTLSPAQIADGDLSLSIRANVEPISHRRIDDRAATESQRHHPRHRRADFQNIEITLNLMARFGVPGDARRLVVVHDSIGLALCFAREILSKATRPLPRISSHSAHSAAGQSKFTASVYPASRRREIRRRHNSWAQMR